nr:hypothetical protein [Staphylococcus aureus]
MTVDSHLYTLTNFEKLNPYLIIIFIAQAQHKKETCQ